ncbi:MAG: hypothetical protein IBX39_05610 [Candidatus Methanoperedenaceae archaeon]|nr:hypothetical protein [Candidatus Methanoperedenaceae archaeon]
MRKVISTGIVLAVLVLISAIASVASADTFKKETITGVEIVIKDADIEHQQPVTKTFDTRLGTITALNNGGNIGELPDPVKLQQEIKDTATKQLPEAGTLGALPISGTIAPYAAHRWGPIYLLYGEVVTVSLSWYPVGSEIIIGLENRDTGVISWGPGMTGGSGTWRISVWQTGNYNVIILNHSGQTVTYNGYISW